MWKPALAIALATLLALALASPASANWTHKGKGELKENASVTFSGELTLTTSAGNVTCPTTIGATLTASSSAGDVNSFTVSEPSKCDLTGSLAAICGTNGLTKVEKTGTWALTADETDITLTSIDIHYSLAKCLIPGFRLKGSSTIAVDKTSAVGKVTPSGTQTLYNALEEESGTGSLGGTLSVSPAGTYGIKTAPSVEPKWTDANKALSKDGELTLSGNFSFSYSGGSVTCPTTQVLSLTAATVEEGDPEGEVKSFSVAKPSECDITGTLAATCKTNGVASVEKTGTWSLTTTEEDITFSNLVLDYKFKECAVSSLRIEGEATLAVEAPIAIEKATFSGEPTIYNAAEEKIGTAELGGTLPASPAKTYAIKEDPHEAETHEAETHTEATHAAEEHAEETFTEGGEPYQWTADGETLGFGEEATAAFEGFFGWTIPSPIVPVHSTFGCPVTITIIAVGLSGGEIESYNPTTANCSGTGIYAGCKLKGDTTNPPWNIDISSMPATVAGPVTIHNAFEGCPTGITTSHLVFESLAVTPSVIGGHLSLDITGKSTSGIFITSGSFTAESGPFEPSLGIE